MLIFKLTISDDQGEISTVEKTFSTSAVLHDFAELETHCEDFVKSCLPDAERELLEYAQSHFAVPEGKKKRKTNSKHTKPLW